MSPILWRTIAALLLCSSAAAASSYLPAPPEALAAIDAHPNVAQAQAMRDAGHFDAQALRQGPHEFTVNARLQQRDIAGAGRFAEWEYGLSRGLRLPAKARADRSSAAALEQSGVEALADARHQIALALHQRWFDALLSSVQARSLSLAAVRLESEQGSTQKRLNLGDASALDLDRVNMALAQAQAQQMQAQGKARTDALLLAAEFPGMSIDAAVLVPEPGASEAQISELQRDIREHSHEISLARAELAYARSRAEHARASRRGDPVIGLYTLREARGDENALGLSVSIPLGGKLRSAQASSAASRADAAQAQLQQIKHQVDGTAQADGSNARAALAAWREHQAAAAAADAQAQRSARAYQLGEIGMLENLLSLRAQDEALRAEAEARIEAHRALTRLQIDAHSLWARAEVCEESSLDADHGCEHEAGR
jgi:outer membrane protein, heavy metal efflux system